MTDRDQIIYRSYAQTRAADDPLPCFEAANRFVYDRAEHGAPTLPKLATVAAHRLVDWAVVPGQHLWLAGTRMWIWTDNGELVGSVVVKLMLDPRLEALDHTIERRVTA